MKTPFNIGKATEKALTVFIYAGLFTPFISFAAATSSGPIFHNIGEVANKLCTVFNWIFTFALILSFVFIVVAGIKYMTAGGNAEKVKEVHKTLLWVVVGIAVALISRGVPALVASFLNTHVGQAC